MKKSNIIKIITFVIAIVVISCISFIGIYVQKNGSVKNVLPDYSLGKEFKGTYFTSFKVNNVTVDNTEIVATDEEGNETSVESNNESLLTKENFELSKNIMEKRLKQFAIYSYDIRYNENDGTIALEVPENSQIEDVIPYLISAGKFEIVDADTNEVLINNNNISEAKTMYYTSTTGTTVYLDIVFDAEGKIKLEDISKTYVQTTDEEGNTTEKKVTLKIDDEEITTTYFGETMTSGELPLSIGSETSDSNTLQNYFVQATELAVILNNGVMPLTYEIDIYEYVEGLFTNDIITNVVIVFSVIIAILSIYVIVRFKTNGIFAVISFIGYIATYLLLARITDTIISIEAMAAIGLSVAITFAFIHLYLKEIKHSDKTAKELYKGVFLKNMSLQIPIYILAVVFVFANWETLRSFGIALFWGLLVSLLYNLVFTRTIMIEKDNISRR